MVWKASHAERGVIPGADAIPGRTHPDLGKKLQTLAPEGQLFVTLLVLRRIEHFRALARAGKFECLIRIGAGQESLSPELQSELAEQFHIDWLAARRMLGLEGHVGDKPWAEETPDEQLNDRLLVNKWCALWHYCAQGGPDGSDEDLKALVEYVRAG